ncbi:D-ribose pyranase [Leucobacter sp. gxy201]|uniref:D-ribose pyranase n=1 Tax=Leucobacter sp. gxy201 TaxID=2957200 RepID=UPI003DA109C2
MKRSGILGRDLLYAIGSLGHTDTFAVADCGLPIPPGVRVIDLAVVAGVPGFLDVLDALTAEVVTEHAIAAVEADDHAAGPALRERFPGLEQVSHEQLKRLTADCRFIVRTGEARPYANVILRSGVPF